MTKTCVSCGLVQEEDLFPLNGGKRARRCQSCKQQYDRDWYQRNKESSQERRKKTRPIIKLRNHQFVLDYLKDHPCITCGEGNPVVLEFDHRDPKEKSQNVSLMVQRSSLLALKKEIDKCDVLCANCHRRKTAEQFGWYAFAQDVNTGN